MSVCKCNMLVMYLCDGTIYFCIICIYMALPTCISLSMLLANHLCTVGIRRVIILNPVEHMTGLLTLYWFPHLL